MHSMKSNWLASTHYLVLLGTVMVFCVSCGKTDSTAPETSSTTTTTEAVAESSTSNDAETPAAADAKKDSAEPATTDSETKADASDDKEPAVIPFKGKDGKEYKCRLLEIIRFEGKEYGVLEKVEDGGLVPMQYTKQDGNAVFSNIKTDEEFQRLSDHISKISKGK